MSESLPTVYLVRHGETAWTISRQHTGRTDLPLTARGEDDAWSLHGRLRGLAFDRVFVSPLRRARQTSMLAGFGDEAVAVADLTEWDYGEYEGLTTAEIRRERPGWSLPPRMPWRRIGRGGRPRADRVIARLRGCRAASWSSATGSSSACWLRGGCGCRRARRAASCSAAPRCPSWATSTGRRIPPSASGTKMVMQYPLGREELRIPAPLLSTLGPDLQGALDRAGQDRLRPRRRLAHRSDLLPLRVPGGETMKAHWKYRPDLRACELEDRLVAGDP